LDSEYALLLQTSSGEPEKFERIGLAMFLVSDIGISSTLIEETNGIEYSKNGTKGLADVLDDYPTVIII